VARTTRAVDDVDVAYLELEVAGDENARTRSGMRLAVPEDRAEAIGVCAEINADEADEVLAVLAGPALNLATCPDDWIESADSPFALLYNEVRKLPGVGYVTCSKLIAAKFPALIPIRDGRVEKMLDLQEDRHWWRPIRELLQSGKVQEALSGITLLPGAPDATTLRRLDVALWMEARSRGIGDRKAAR
jgi:hypothetical protein